MKRIERMATSAAWEFARELAKLIGEVPTAGKAYENGFKAGFRAAREMAAEKVAECEREALQRPNLGVPLPWIRDQLRELGEVEAD